MLSNGEQKLLQKLVYDLLKECICHIKGGHKGRFRKQQFNSNIMALKEIDVEYLIVAGFGFKRICKIREIITNLLSSSHDYFIKTKRLQLASSGK